MKEREREKLTFNVSTVELVEGHEHPRDGWNQQSTQIELGFQVELSRPVQSSSSTTTTTSTCVAALSWGGQRAGKPGLVTAPPLHHRQV